MRKFALRSQIPLEEFGQGGERSEMEKSPNGHKFVTCRCYPEFVISSEHQILRARPDTPGLSGTTARREGVGAGGSLPVDTFSKGPILDELLPDLSGFANFSRSRLLAVRDSKDTSPDARVLFVNKKDGAVTPVNMDWSKTGTARDLEAVTPNANGGGGFLAVEGSSFGEKRARLFELSVGQKNGTADKSHILPDFGQEIEGMTSLKGENGNQTVLFAGRGGNGQQGRIYWGELGADGLSFSQEGLNGQAVHAPQIGEGQRDLAELTVDGQGKMWGAAATDNGDDGPFTSALYQVGQLTPGGAAPFQVSQGGPSVLLNDIKAEAVSAQGNGKFFIGSDNESFGGRIDTIG